MCFHIELPRWCSGKEPTCQCRRCKRYGFDPWVAKIPWRRAWQSSPASLPGESHGQESLADCSLWGRTRVGHDWDDLARTHARTYCAAQGTVLSVMWQPGWKGRLGEDGYMYMYGWVPWLFTWNYHNIVNWLYPNTKQKLKKSKC